VGSRAARVKRRVPRRRKIRRSLVVAARIRKIREAVVAVIVKPRRRIVIAVFRSLRLVKLTSTLKKRKATLSSYNRKDSSNDTYRGRQVNNVLYQYIHNFRINTFPSFLINVNKSIN